MIGELVCPDCGGVVGATETTEAGAPCRCFSGSSSSSASVSGTLSGTSVSRYADPSGGDDASAHDVLPPPPPLKVCRICGTDLNGHRRFKDGQGYTCPPCYEEEQKRLNYGRVPCPVCGHLTKEEKLTDYEGRKMCPKCHDERTTLRRTEIKRMGFSGARTRDELRQLYVGLIAGGALVFIILVGVVIKHFHH
jgi:hypothetical protein